MKNKGSKPKAKKKGGENAFGCDLTEHLRTSGQDVPQVLMKCAEFIEKHGVVDGIYRLSGVTSNIQRLRQEFCSEAGPDLTKEVYLQDIHCVGSLCKLYFRELPNPLLTYELYHKFTKAVSIQGDQEKLLQIQSVIKELPVPHFRTLEYLTKHLAHLATLSPQTNMHTRNLALVWAPNLLRSKDIEASSCNGDMAFQEVRVQQSVVEFILNHTEQIFNHGAVQIKPKEGLSLVCGEKYATLPISSQCGPMKLMSLEEAQARSLGPNHPAHRERQRENSLPDTSAAGFYHTAIDITDSKRKFSEKSKKWKSIFSLGKDSKGRLSRNGSVFIRGPNISEKMTVRPARSMDSLCSLPTDDDRGFSPACGANNSVLVPDVKSRTLESEILYGLSEQEPALDLKGKIAAAGAAGGSSPGRNQRGSTARSPGASAPPLKALPEQLKVFKGDNLSGYQPTSPKSRRMLYTGSSHNSSSRPSFPGNFFPLESSPRHQRKALNISEPFAVSVPLRVSAVISSNSTPCRAPGKEPPAATTCNKALNSRRETSLSEQSTNSGSSGYSENSLGDSRVPSESSICSKSLSLPLLDTERHQETAEESREETLTKSTSEDSSKEVAQEGQGRLDISELEQSPTVSMREDKETAPPPGKQRNNQLVEHQQPKVTQLDKGSSAMGKELWSDLNHELKITEPEIDKLEEEFKPAFCSKSTEDAKLKPKRRNSSPAQPLLCGGQPFMPSNTPTSDLLTATGLNSQPSESDILFSFHKNCDFMLSADTKNPLPHSLDLNDETENKTYQISPGNEALCIDKHVDTKNVDTNFQSVPQSKVVKSLQTGDTTINTGLSVANDNQEASGKRKVPQEDKNLSCNGGGKENVSATLLGGVVERLSVCLEVRPDTLELPNLDDEDGCGGGNSEELELVEPWEDLSFSTKQWVTSPLHSPSIQDLFASLSPFCATGETPNSQEENTSSSPFQSNKQSHKACPVTNAELFTGSSSQTYDDEPETKGSYLQTVSIRAALVGDNAAQPHIGNCGTAKLKNTQSSSQRFHRQASQEISRSQKNEENCFAKHRPNSLNLDLGHRCIRDISNQQNNHISSEFSFSQRGSVTPSGTTTTTHAGLPLELELFLKDRQAPVRRNSAPVSVSSVRTAFMIKTCQAKAVPVIPPKVQYSQIPHSRHDNKGLDGIKGQEKEYAKMNRERVDSEPPPLQTITDLKEEIENKEPAPKYQRQPILTDKSAESLKTPPAPELPVIRRRHPSHAEIFADCARPDRSNLFQRSSFRSRQRPQSLILLSPPFPIMDYPPLGDDSKFPLSPIKSLTDTSAEMTENLKNPEGITLPKNKMTIPKSGQRLETSTSCFYQPQRRSMIFDSRSHRQIE